MYERFYGFLAKPFEVVPDPKFLYRSPSHLETISAVLTGIKEQKGLIVMTGEVGTGKTTLIRFLLQKLDQRVKTAFIFYTAMAFSDLIRSILHDLDVGAPSREDPASLWNRLVDYSGQISAGKGALVILIDEAQDLGESVLEELIERFSSLQSNLFQIILAGQPELETKLRSGRLKPFGEKIEVWCRVNALTENESKEYIDHRLSVAGCTHASLFTPQALSLICLHSRGIPRMINVLCDNALLAGYSLSSQMIDDAIIGRVVNHLEGPHPERKLSTSSRSLRKPETVHSSLLRGIRRMLVVLFVLVCLGGLTLLALRLMGQTGQKSADTPTSKQAVQPDSIQKPIQPQQEPAKTADQEGPTPAVNDEKPSVITSIPPIPPKVDRKQGNPDETFIVKEKDTLSAIAKKHYGLATLSLLDIILSRNPEITNVNYVTVDQRIILPHVTEESLIVQPHDGNYKIHVGTFGSPGESRAFQQETSLKGKKVEVTAVRVAPEETWYRVVIGKFVDKQEALKTIQDLRKKGLLPWLQEISLTKLE